MGTDLMLPLTQTGGNLSHATDTDQWPPARTLGDNLQNLRAHKRSKQYVLSLNEPMNSAVQCRYFQQIIFSCFLFIPESLISCLS